MRRANIFVIIISCSKAKLNNNEMSKWKVVKWKRITSFGNIAPTGIGRYVIKRESGETSFPTPYYTKFLIA